MIMQLPSKLIQIRKAGTMKDYKKRLEEIEDRLMDGENFTKFYFLALKSVCGTNLPMNEIKKIRDFVKYTAEAMDFDYADVVEEVAFYHLRKMAVEQLFKEIKVEEKSTIAIAKSAPSLELGLYAVNKYGEVRRKNGAASIDINLLDEPLPILPF